MNRKASSFRARIAVMVATLTMACLTVLVPASAAKATMSCSSLMVIGARGSGEVYTPETLGMGPFNYSAYQQIKTLVPDAWAYGLPYSAVAVAPASPGSNTFNVLANGYWDSISIGSILVRQRVEQSMVDCPNQRIALLGYSQGAHVIGELLSVWGTNQGVLDHIAGILTFGDPRFNPAWPFAQGSYNASLEGAFSARTVGSAWWGKIRAYCNDLDFVCNWSPQNMANCPIPSPANCGHFSYGPSGSTTSGGAWLGNLVRSLPPLSLPPAPPPPSSGNPFGYLDEAGLNADKVFVRGWAIDPDTTGPITVYTYIDGTLAGATTANASRPDVGAAYPGYGNNHGYYAVYAAGPGTHQVCTYAINTGAGNANPQLPSCKTVLVGPPPSNYQVYAADFNGDHLADIGLRDTSNGNFFMKHGAGFNDQIMYSWAPGTHYQPYAADFNNDGAADIGMRDPSNGIFFIKHGLGFGDQISYTWAAGAHYQAFAADFNADGFADIGLRDTTTGIFFMRFGPSFATQISYQWAPGAHYQVFVADFNGGGAEIGLRDTTTGWFFIKYAPSFNTQTSYQWVAGTNYQPFASDFDGNGLADIDLRDLSNGNIFIKHGPGFNDQIMYAWARG